MDSAFGLQGKDFLIKSSQEDPQIDAHAVALNRQATSLRQLSEHGMRMIQGQFPRLKDNFQLEEFGERKTVLHLMHTPVANGWTACCPTTLSAIALDNICGHL